MQSAQLHNRCYCQFRHTVAPCAPDSFCPGIFAAERGGFNVVANEPMGNRLEMQSNPSLRF